MGKRRFNAKGRQVINTITDDTSTKQIKLDIPEAKVDDYGPTDSSNILVLPSKKRSTKLVKTQTGPISKILSKKQRRNLEKIVDKKKKKEGRAELLEKLANVQLPVGELQKYTSIINVQTKGLKNHLKDRQSSKQRFEADQKSIGNDSGSKSKSNLLKGYRGSIQVDSDEETVNKPRDFNVIGFDESESESDGSDTEPEVIGDPDPKIDIKIESKPEERVIITEPVVQPIEPIKPTVYVHVNRTETIQAARLKLPILGEEQQIMEAINENSIVIIAGETGSGKTTQIPQFLYEAGYAERKMIGITEPRRVAAISMSKRVGHEMNLSASVCSYLIRFEGNCTDQTRIKFMTDGVLLKEIEVDFILSRYSVIILDECHERSIFTDILLGLLSRIVPLRAKRGNPLKLIVMSATLRVTDFTENQKLFKSPPPILSVDSRQFPVTVHFNRRTPVNYAREAGSKAVKIHTKLPDGGILIFLTGQQEVNYLVKKLRKAFPYRPVDKKKSTGNPQYSDPDDNDSDCDLMMKKMIDQSKKNRKKFAKQISLPRINLDNYRLPTDDTVADLLDTDRLSDDGDLYSGSSDEEDDNEMTDALSNITNLQKSHPLWVLPLYSLLPSDKQNRVFESAPDGTRLCVVSTNVAETSITIPNIKYVIDSGRQKTRLYDRLTGVSSFVVTYTSKASASQRMGRAGRTGPGHCYRLYSSAVYADEFPDFSPPDIQQKPVDDLMLQMKCMGIDKVLNFPYPSPPDPVQMAVAERRLKQLGALTDEKLTGNKFLSKVTPLGLAMAAFPVAPRFGKMLALSNQQNLLPYTVCMVAALSVQEVLIEVMTMGPDNGDSDMGKWYAKRRNWAGSGNSLLLGDPVVLLRAVGAAEFTATTGDLTDFCRTNGIRPKGITEIRKLRHQLTNEICLNMPEINLTVDPKMKPPTDLQTKLLRQILLSGMGDQVARRIPDDEHKDSEDRRKFKYGYRCPDMEDPVFIHSSSVLRKSRPEWVIYQEVYEIQNGDDRKMFMRGLTAIEPEWLLTYCRSLCNIRTIKEDPSPRYSPKDGKIWCYVDSTFGRAGWEIPLAEMEMPLCELGCKYFAMFFLTGDIFPAIGKYRKQMRSSPVNVTKLWTKSIVHVQQFVGILQKFECQSRQRLLELWEKEPKFLLNEFCEFLIDPNLSEISLHWPPTKDED